MRDNELGEFPHDQFCLNVQVAEDLIYETTSNQLDDVAVKSGTKPSFELHKMTLVFRVLEIIVGIILFHRPVGVMTRAGGVEGVSLLDLRCRTRQSRADFGSRSWSPGALWNIFFTLPPLFWVVKVSVMNVVD